MPASGSSAVEMQSTPAASGGMVPSLRSPSSGNGSNGGGGHTTHRKLLYLSVDLLEKLVEAKRGKTVKISTFRIASLHFSLSRASSTFSIYRLGRATIFPKSTSRETSSNHSSNLHSFPESRASLAARNHLQFICSTDTARQAHMWPVQMAFLREVDLSYNRLTRIPDITSMPNLQKLDLHHNLIQAPWDELKAGAKLEFLDLSYNQLDWTTPDFVKATSTLRSLRSLKELYLAGNPIVERMPEYHIHCLGELRASSGPLGRMKRIDEHTINKALRERCDRLLSTMKRQPHFTKI